jgi:CRP-like cAMP-binding protein
MVVDGSRLKQIPLFARLSARQRNHVARHVREVEIARGEHVVDEGDAPQAFFVIEEGTAAVVSGGKHVTDLGPGDFLGEIGLVKQSERTASVIATSPMRALVIPAEDFREIRRSMPEVAREVDAAIEERLARDRLFGLER